MSDRLSFPANLWGAFRLGGFARLGHDLAWFFQGETGETMEDLGIFSIKHGEAIGKLWKNSG